MRSLSQAQGLVEKLAVTESFPIRQMTIFWDPEDDGAVEIPPCSGYVHWLAVIVTNVSVALLMEELTDRLSKEIADEIDAQIIEQLRNIA
jgi:hypothetical protein